MSHILDDTIVVVVLSRRKASGLSNKGAKTEEICHMRVLKVMLCIYVALMELTNNM